MRFAKRGGLGRRRRRISPIGLKWLLAVLVVGLAALYAYSVGSRLAQVEIERLEDKIAALTSRVAELDRRDASHTQTLDAARARADRWRRAYERDVPSGENKALYETMLAKLDEGVSRERLAFVIAAASEERDCDSPLPAKRFIVATPLQRVGPNNAVSFHDGTVIVSATGAPASDDQGNAEAWFDPGEPVTVRIVTLSGRQHEETGLLPLHPSLVVGGVEHRLSVLAGPARGFARASLQTCRYP